MAGVQFGAVAFYDDIAAYLEWLHVTEALGFDLAACGDTQNLAPEMLVNLTAAALNTRRIRIGSLVSNPSTRHPAVAASGLAAIQKLAGGRLFFGIGTGDSALKNIGLRAAKVDDFAAYCHAIKRLCAGEEVVYQGHPVRLQWQTAPVPVWISAEGPRMMHLAGQIGDGAIFANGISEDVIKDNLRRVRAGAESVGRDPDRLEIWFLVKVVFADSEQQTWQDLAWTLAASANHSFRHSMEGKFVPEHLQEGMRNLERGYASHQHNIPGQGAHNASLVIDNGLTEYLGRRFLIAGSPQRIVERIHEITGFGARNLIFTAIFGDKIALTRRIAQEIMPSFRVGAGPFTT